ncbi:hypothetical protein WMY93_019143 [Mugilogobius chulae]|uniref:CRIB domain-containing protein n=1 Tax=Mugilogobius chulae TaxID=88201 RepID=A0AAW0NDC3_9GOBI
MPDYYSSQGAPLSPSANQRAASERGEEEERRIDRSMIGEPTNFIHLTHIGSGDAAENIQPMGSVQDQIRTSGVNGRSSLLAETGETSDDSLKSECSPGNYKTTSVKDYNSHRPAPISPSPGTTAPIMPSPGTTAPISPLTWDYSSIMLSPGTTAPIMPLSWDYSSSSFHWTAAPISLSPGTAAPISPLTWDYSSIMHFTSD